MTPPRYRTELGVICRVHGRVAEHDEPCWPCERIAEEDAAMDMDAALRFAREQARVERVRRALEFLFIRIGSWTNARFDQHLRHEFGDTIADETLEWLAEHVSTSLGPGPNGEPMYRSEPTEPTKGER